MKRLVLCGACERHVRVEERACPFCGAPCDAEPAAVAEGVRYRGRPGGRAALFLAGVAGAASSVGCDKKEEEAPTPVYGVPIDAGVNEDGGGGDDGGAADGDGSAGEDAMAAPVYGVPVDAGSDTGQVAPVYGVPIDAGEEINDALDGGDAEVMAVPLYGLALDVEE